MGSESESYPTPPQAPPQWSHTPSTILPAMESALARSKSLLDSLSSLPHEKCTFETVVVPLANDEARLATEVEWLLFYKNVSTDEELRKVAGEGEKIYNEFETDSLMRLPIYQALLAAEQNTQTTSLDPESKRLLERMIRDRKRAGLGLDEAKRTKLTEIKKELQNLGTDFSKNFNEENGSILFTLEELNGVPEDIVSGFAKEIVQDGSTGKDVEKRRMTFKTPDVFPVWKYATNPMTRKRAHVGYESKLSINEPILERMFDLRREQASLLDYDTWADFKIEPKMAKTAKTALDFLDDLYQRLKPIGIKERDALLELKKQEFGKEGWEFDGNFYVWDYRYYDRIYLEKNLDLDNEKIKEYFPVETVVSKILQIYQKLLSVRFFQVPNAKTWHKDATQWAVWDSEKVGKEGGFLGYMHLDLFPREGKYSHAAVWGLIPGYDKEDGSRNYPVAAMVANLAKPTPSKPALMKHDDVVTFFHEMGHAFHQLCSRTKYSRFHGTSVARDFVEAPSQMLENWCWTRSELAEMSSHYQRPDEKLPDDVIDRILKSRNVNQGLFNLRQLFFGKFDMLVHTSKEPIQDYTKLWCELREEVSLVKFEGAYAPGQSSFGHIAGGYDAGYYGYLYSQAFSADMFETIFSKSPMDPARGMLYRNEILLPGGSRDEMDSLKAFLGREPNNKAFLKQLLGGASGTQTAEVLQAAS